jgi:hypothetical protein
MAEPTPNLSALRWSCPGSPGETLFMTAILSRKRGMAMTNHMLREAVASFPDPQHLEAAADELMLHGFDRSYLSLMATEPTVERSLGHLYRRVEEVADDPKAPHGAFVDQDSETEAKAAAAATLAYIGAVAAAGAVVASDGALGLALAAAAMAGGAGGAIGAALAPLIGARHAHTLQEQRDHGGILLWVRTIDAEAERTACDILARNGGTNIHVHEFPAAEPGRDGGVSEDLAWINKPIGEWFGRHAA